MPSTFRDVLHFIADDLDDSTWYRDLAADTIDAIERFTARWAEFEEHAARFADDAFESEA